jgi:hypothetical protein
MVSPNLLRLNPNQRQTPHLLGEAEAETLSRLRLHASSRLLVAIVPRHYPVTALARDAPKLLCVD